MITKRSRTPSLVALSPLVLLLLLSLGVPASATLMSVDDPSFGPDSVTRQINGLEWLDHDLSAGCSYEDISQKTGCGIVFNGWRYARRAEILDLWFEAGFVPGDYGFGDEWLAIDQLAGLMGGECYSGDFIDSECSLWASFDDTLDGVDSDLVGEAGAWAGTYGGGSDAAGAYINIDAVDISSVGLSSWLVRVPEPTSFALLGLGLAGIGYRRHKQIKAA